MPGSLCPIPKASRTRSRACCLITRQQIAPRLRDGERVIVAAHGNSLRALEKHLSNIADDDIVGLEIPTGQPIVYELGDDLAVHDRYYLSER